MGDRFAIAFSPEFEATLAGVGCTPANSYVEIDASTLAVQFGDTFSMEAPRECITSVAAVGDLKEPSIGVHGGDGEWLVNGSPRGLCRVTFESPAEASFSPRLPANVPKAVAAALRRTLRPRIEVVCGLVVSLEDVDGFIAAVSARKR